MNPTRFWWPAVALACLGAWTSAHALTNPPIRMAQGVEYMCGGNNRDEAAFMQTVSPRWAAALEFAVNRGKPGAMPGDVEVEVRERYSGKPVMHAVAGARFMLARLEPGAYEVQATLGGITLRQPLVVFNGRSSRAVFVWPSNIDFAALTGESMPVQQAAATID